MRGSSHQNRELALMVAGRFAFRSALVSWPLSRIAHPAGSFDRAPRLRGCVPWRRLQFAFITMAIG
jgi:hypothetical protein